MKWSVYYSEKYDKIALIRPDNPAYIRMTLTEVGFGSNGFMPIEAFIESDYELIGYL
jgi:hypothetical protein